MLISICVHPSLRASGTVFALENPRIRLGPVNMSTHGVMMPPSSTVHLDGLLNLLLPPSHQLSQDTLLKWEKAAKETPNIHLTKVNILVGV